LIILIDKSQSADLKVRPPLQLSMNPAFIQVIASSRSWKVGRSSRWRRICRDII